MRVATDGRRPERKDQTVKLPTHLRRRLRVSGAYLDREISDIVADAVTLYLDGVDRDRQQRGLSPLPRPED